MHLLLLHPLLLLLLKMAAAGWRGLQVLPAALLDGLSCVLR
jgi:hypothetical protein